MTWIAVAVSVGGTAYGAYNANRNRQQAASAASAGANAADPAASYRPTYMAYMQGLFPKLSNVDPTGITSDPNFAFMHDMGMRDINNKASAEGTLRSGTLMEDMSKFNTSLANTFIGDQFNRNMALMGQLGNFSGLNIGNPGVAGQITAQSGRDQFNMGNNVMGQLGGAASLASRYLGSSGATGNTGTGFPTDAGGNLQFDP